LSPYVINYLNSFSDVNASQAAEFIIRQYMYICKRAQPIEEPIVNNHVEKQHIKPDPIRSAKSNLSTRQKRIKPTK
jgi:hypothetical protein